METAVNPLSDSILDHLRGVAELPDFTGTRYLLDHEIGRGGMGIVYQANDTRLSRKVAIKVLNVADRTGAAAARMLDEARIVASLEHPGIVPIYDAGTLSDGRVYYAMKLVEGAALGNAGTLPDRLRLFQKICDTVAFAHSRGVVHLDLKPENIMTGAFGEVLIMDWGIARESTSRGGIIAGTPSFMAPEQAAGDVSPLADIYSLGAILKTFLPTPGPSALAAIAAKAAAHEKTARYSNVADLAADIEHYLDGMPVSAYRETTFERLSRWAFNNRVLLLLILAYVLVRLVLLFLRFL
jgi:serine/threonine-protein kinase